MPKRLTPARSRSYSAGAGAEVHIGDGAGGDAGVGIRHQLHFLIVEVNAVGVVEAVAQQVVTAEPFGGPAAVVFLHKGDFATAFRQMTVHLDIQLFRQIDGSTDDFFRFIIGDAGADADLTHRETGRIVVLFTSRSASPMTPSMLSTTSGGTISLVTE